MKLNLVALFLLLIVVLAQCATQKKVEYVFPQLMSAAIQSEYYKQCEKGRILYEINCANCHTIKVKGKSYIPDFSSDQLRGYELRVANALHEDSIREENVSAEELGLIMTFLQYKKKNPETVRLNYAHN